MFASLGDNRSMMSQGHSPSLSRCNWSWSWRGISSLLPAFKTVFMKRLSDILTSSGNLYHAAGSVTTEERSPKFISLHTCNWSRSKQGCFTADACWAESSIQCVNVLKEKKFQDRRGKEGSIWCEEVWHLRIHADSRTQAKLEANFRSETKTPME